jgi:O-antigen/teichoic acid export membrane protein
VNRRPALGRALGDPLLRSTYSQLLNSASSALLGLAFWVVCARLQSSWQVGRDSVLIAAMMTLTSVAQLNLANTITRFVPRAGPRTRRWILRAYGSALAATIIAATLFALLVPLLAPRLSFLRHDLPLTAAFVLACALWTIFGLQDAVLAALRRAPWIPLENSIFGLLKLAFLPALAAASLADAIFISWAIPMLLLLIPVNYMIFCRFVPAHERSHTDAPPLDQILPGRGVRSFVAADLGGSVLNQAAMAMPPLLVVALIGSSANAYFYVPFALAVSFDTLFFNAGISLVVEGAFGGESLEQLAQRVTRLFAKLAVPGVLALLAGAPLILLAYGHRYGARGVDVLRLLACASAFRVVVSLATSIMRVQGRGGAIMRVYGALMVVLVPLLVVLTPASGIDGAALAWLAANACAAALAAPTLITALRAPARPQERQRATKAALANERVRA